LTVDYHLSTTPRAAMMLRCRQVERIRRFYPEFRT
jgi:hypothetical protein